jgi:hypothetical protein
LHFTAGDSMAGKTIGSENLEVNFQKEKAIGDV